HCGNALVSSNLPTEWALAYNIGGVLLKVDRSNCAYWVKLIDYGMVTKGHPRDRKYHEDHSKEAVHALPFLDVAQLLTDVSDTFARRLKRMEREGESEGDIKKIKEVDSKVGDLSRILADHLTWEEKGRGSNVLKENLGLTEYLQLAEAIKQEIEPAATGVSQ